MLQHIADHSLEMDPDHAAAHVALFALTACLPTTDQSTNRRDSYVLHPDNAHLSQDDLVTRLAQHPKPVWLDAKRTDRSMDVEIGPLASRPLIKRLYEAGQDLRSKRPPEIRKPHPDAVILCFTDTAGLRVRRKAFDRYERDYMLAPPCIYAGGSIDGHYPIAIGLDAAELDGVAEVIRIVPGGHGVIWISGDEQAK